MALPPFRIKPYQHPRLKFVVRSKLTGKWERRFFASKGDAQTYVQLKEAELLNQGREGATFPSWLRVMAQRENARLEKFGKTITDATDFYVKHLSAVSRSVLLRESVDELIENRRATGATSRYCYDIGLRLGRFCKDFEQRVVAEISTKEIDEWLAKLALAPVTRNTFRRDITTLFSFAVSREYCAANPATKTRKAKAVDAPIKILTVGQVERLLEHATLETTPYWAIGAFAGLRRAEIERLEWDAVDFEANTIEVTAKNSKTASRRLVTIQPNLAKWLKPYQNRTGKVCPVNLRTLLDQDRIAAELLADWPPNALRHSFGSYHLAAYNDIQALALQMGNSPNVIFRHYRQLVKLKAATGYWLIEPTDETTSKLIAFKR